MCQCLGNKYLKIVRNLENYYNVSFLQFSSSYKDHIFKNLKKLLSNQSLNRMQAN